MSYVYNPTEMFTNIQHDIKSYVITLGDTDRLKRIEQETLKIDNKFPLEIFDGVDGRRDNSISKIYKPVYIFSVIKLRFGYRV